MAANLLPDELRAAALRLRASVGTRINGPQGGVPTFFDTFLMQLIERLSTTEALHGWRGQADLAPGAEAGSLTSALQCLDEYLARRDHPRLVSYAARRAIDPSRACDIGQFELLASQGMTDCLAWKGLPLFKTAFDFALLPMLLHELQPATILEIGSGSGASARWMAAISVAAGLPVRVLSVDIQRATAGGEQGVEFFQGDVRVPESLFGAQVLAGAAHPWLLIEDAHVNVGPVLAYFDHFLQRGDYLIVEDSREKHEILGAWITDRYLVDTRYTDFFGRNATSAADAIFAVTG